MTLLVVLLVYVPIALLRGFVLSMLWQWFVEPLGAPNLSIVYAVGIALIVAYLTISIDDLDKPATPVRDLLRQTMHVVIYSLLTLAFGFAWSLVR